MTELTLYLHIPFCRRRCRYCSFVSTAGRAAEIPEYTRALINEIGLRRRKGAIVKSIYFGGGTPSLLGVPQIKAMLDAIRTSYPVAEGAEVTLEVNPGTIDGVYLHNIRDGGINRLSLGIQSLDENELKLLGRQHGTAEAKEAVHLARLAGFDNLSLDFIYGVPGRGIREWRSMIGEITSLNAEHLSLYALSIEDGTELAEAVGCGDIARPNPDDAAEEYELACEALEREGYLQYEISNWARPGYESRHNLTYWTGGDYLGLGCGAHSFLDGVRCAGTDNLDEYLNALGAGCLPGQTEDRLIPRTALGEAMILGLRLSAGVAADNIKERFGVNPHEHFCDEIAELSALGLLEADGDCLKLTPRGRLLGNEVFIRFLP